MVEVSCINCKHHYITWDPSAPKGCRIFQFKSAQLPSVIVKNETGEDCKAFTPKKPSGEQKVDFNDPKYW